MKDKIFKFVFLILGFGRSWRIDLGKVILVSKEILLLLKVPKWEGGDKIGLFPLYFYHKNLLAHDILRIV